MKESGKVTSGELPFERRGDARVLVLKSEDAFAQLDERGRVVGREHFALQDGEEYLDLIQPTGVQRKMDEAELAIGNTQSLDGPLAAVRGAVIDDPEDSLGRSIGLSPHDLVNQPAEGCDARFLLQATEQFRPMDVPSGEVSERAAPVVLMLDEHGMALARRPRWVAADTSLDGGLLICRDDVFPDMKPFSFETTGIKIENSAGLGLEVGISRRDPAAMPPGPDGILRKPLPNGGAGDVGDQAPPDHLGPDIGNVEPGQGQAELGWQFTDDGLDRDHQLWGGKRASGSSVPAPQGRRGVPRRSAYATWTQSAPGWTNERRSPCSAGPERP